MSNKFDVNPDDIIFEEVVAPENTETPTYAERTPVMHTTATGQEIELRPGPGRPRKTDKVPTVKELQYYALVVEAKNQKIEEDPLVRQIRAHGDTADMLQTVKLEMAKEVAALGQLRVELDKQGKDTGSTSSRRIDGLKKLTEVELEQKKLGAVTVDLKSEKMQRVFAYFIGKIKDVAVETLSPESIDLFFNKLSTALDGWEDACNDEIANKTG
jgi:hypothetical protein